MRVSNGLVGLCLALAAAGGFLAFRSSSADGGQSAVITDWKGRVSFTDYSLSSGKPSHGSFPATMNTNQNGSNINILLSIDAEDGLQQFSFSGSNGNGNFWASNGNSANPFIVSGHIAGSGDKRKLKTAGIFVDGTELNELKMNFKVDTGPK